MISIDQHIANERRRFCGRLWGQLAALAVTGLYASVAGAALPRGARGEDGFLPRTRRTGRRVLRIVPPAYTNAALAARVPPRLLYGIALQESAMAFGERILPWLWTLNVRGTPHRYATYGDGVRALRHFVVVKGVRNVDCGPMQVNWYYHAHRLRSFENALDAHANLAVGASILAGHFQDSRDWYVATGRYHHPTDAVRAGQYARAVFRRVTTLVDSA